MAGKYARVVAVLPGGDIGVAAVPDLPQPGEVIGGDRLLEPADLMVPGQVAADPDGLLPAVSAVGVDVQFDGVTDHLPGQGHPGKVAFGAGAPGLADLDLDPRNPGSSTHPSSWPAVVGSS